MKIVYQLTGCVCAVLMLLALSFPAHAEETQSQYVLQISYGQDTDKGDIAPIKGAYFTIYQVAVLTSKGYEYIEPYASVTKTALLDCGKDGKEMENIAKNLANIVNHSSQSGVTDDNGQLSVPAKAGAYLVVQTGTVRDSTAEQYITASPFFVQVPSIDKDGLVDEKVTKAYPKTEKIRKNETKPNTPSNEPNDNAQTTTGTNGSIGATEGNTTDDSSSEGTTDKTGDETDTGTTEDRTSDSHDTGNNPPSRTEQTGDSPVSILLFAAGCGFLIIGVVINSRTEKKKHEK